MQGVFSPSSFGDLRLPGPWYGAMEYQYPPEQRQGSYEEEGRAINTLKGAITTADRIVAVSPGVLPRSLATFFLSFLVPLCCWEFLIMDHKIHMDTLKGAITTADRIVAVSPGAPLCCCVFLIIH